MRTSIQDIREWEKLEQGDKIDSRSIALVHLVDWKLKSKTFNLSSETRICKFSGSKIEKLYKELLKQGHIDNGENMGYKIFLETNTQLVRHYWASRLNAFEEFDLVCSLIGITFQGYLDLTNILHVSVNRDKVYNVIPIFPKMIRPTIDFLVENKPVGFAIDSRITKYLKNAWCALFKGIKERKYNRLFNAVRFYSLACTSLRKSEAILDLVISLETLFAPQSQSEISHQVAVNISKFLRSEVDDRKKLYRQVKKIYDDRSKIVHGHMPKKEEEFLNNLEIAFDISAKAIFKVLLSPTMRKIFSDESLRAEYLEELCFS